MNTCYHIIMFGGKIGPYEIYETQRKKKHKLESYT